MIAELEGKGLAVKSEGATVVVAEGYKVPLMVRKSDGGYGYDSTDITAYRRVSELQLDGRGICPIP